MESISQQHLKCTTVIRFKLILQREIELYHKEIEITVVYTTRDTPKRSYIPDVTDRNGSSRDKEINYKAGDDVKQSRLKSPLMACHSINKPLPDMRALISLFNLMTVTSSRLSYPIFPWSSRGQIISPRDVATRIRSLMKPIKLIELYCFNWCLAAEFLGYST